MSASRRAFLKWSAALAGAVGLGRLSGRPLEARGASVRKRQEVGRAAAPLSILVIGGTGFTGPEQVEFAVAEGDEVVLQFLPLPQG